MSQDYDYKIKKYRYKLKKSKTGADTKVYHKKLDYYYGLQNQMHGGSFDSAENVTIEDLKGLKDSIAGKLAAIGANDERIKTFNKTTDDAILKLKEAQSQTGNTELQTALDTCKTDLQTCQTNAENCKADSEFAKQCKTAVVDINNIVKEKQGQVITVSDSTINALMEKVKSLQDAMSPTEPKSG